MVDGKTLVDYVWVCCGQDYQGTSTDGYPTITLNKNVGGTAVATYTLTVKCYTEACLETVIVCIPVFSIGSWTKTNTITADLWINGLGQ